MLLADRFVRRKDAPVATAPRGIDVRDVIAYSEMTATTFRLRSDRDVLPGGYLAAQAPILIDWNRSDLAAGEIAVRNINDGGNPVAGETVLRSAVIRMNRLKSAEIVMVPIGGPRAISHAQLRFVFAPGGVRYVVRTDEVVGEVEESGDFVLSWEAWHPPGVEYHVLQGMDRGNYELTARGYSGQQCLLEDELKKRDWTAHALRLPGEGEGLAELLKVSLTLADGAARHSIGRMLDKAEHEWTTHGPAAEKEGGDAAAEWRALSDEMRRVGAPDADPRLDMSGRTSYQTFVRSCATMALYSINVAVARAIQAGVPHAGMRTTRLPEMQNEPPWMAELASANLAGVFVRTPKAIGFVRDNPTSIPGRIPDALDEAGLLARENGEPLKRRYSLEDGTPWGLSEKHLLR